MTPFLALRNRTRSPLRNVRLRPFRSGDETTLVDLFNQAFRDYGGFVPRTPEHWRWSILQRPGVEPEDVRILEREADGTVVAYGVVDRDGKVLEFAVEPTLARRHRRRLARRLLDVLEARARERGADYVRLKVPVGEAAMRAALRGGGYREEEIGALQLVFVDLAGFLRRLLAHRAEEAEPDPPAFRFELEPGSYRFAPHRRLLVRAGRPPEVSVDPGAVEVDGVLSCEMLTLCDVIFGRLATDDALESGAIQVRPTDRRGDAEALLRRLVIRAPWYSPIADGR